MHECAELGIKHVWMHQGPGAGSVSDAATGYGGPRHHCDRWRLSPESGPTADFGHKISAYARWARAEAGVNQRAHARVGDVKRER